MRLATSINIINDVTTKTRITKQNSGTNAVVIGRQMLSFTVNAMRFDAANFSTKPILVRRLMFPNKRNSISRWPIISITARSRW